MRYIASEEAFFTPELAQRQPTSAHQQLMRPMKPEFGGRHERRLPDFTEYRLLTSPGLQVDVDAERARDNARFANDGLAKIIAAHPDRFRGFAALPL
jgi:2,3-dihydroxybenzoate decarboxylase